MTGVGDWDVYWDTERRNVEVRWRQELETGGEMKKQQRRNQA